jgi:hypothetical protein
MAQLVFDGPQSRERHRVGMLQMAAARNIMVIPCLQVWRRAGLCAAGLARSDETLVDVAPSPPRSRLQAGGQRVVGFLVVRPGVLAR